MSSNVCNLVDDSLPSGWTLISAGEFIKKKSASFNIAKEEQRVVELYSVPSHETGLPEILDSKEIGSNKQYVSEGDILLSKINPRLNRAWVVGNHSYHDKIASTEWIVFEKNEKIIPSFLKYALTTNRVKEYLAHNSSGVGGSLTRVKPVIMNSIFLGVPSIDQQKRIVAKIEELFSELDNGIAALKTAREQLKVYRQAVLKHAFEGKLTAKWREENQDKLETPEQLLARIQQEREARYQQQLEEWKQAVKEWEAKSKEGKKPSKPKKLTQLTPIPDASKQDFSRLPTGWSYIRLGSLIDEPTYGTSAKCDYEARGQSVLRIPNITMGRIDDSDLKFAKFDKGEVDHLRLMAGDILTIRSNGSISLVGSCALINKKDTKHIFAGYLIRLRPNSKTIKSEYLLSAMSSHFIRKQIESYAKSTSGVNNINSGELQNLIIPLTFVEEQEKLISQLDSLLPQIDSAEIEIDKQLAKAKILRQSILKKAFSGQLATQEGSAL